MRNDGLNTPQKLPGGHIFEKDLFPWQDWIMHFLSHENIFCPTNCIKDEQILCRLSWHFQRNWQKDLELKCKILMDILVLHKFHVGFFSDYGLEKTRRMVPNFVLWWRVSKNIIITKLNFKKWFICWKIRQQFKSNIVHFKLSCSLSKCQINKKIQKIYVLLG